MKVSADEKKIVKKKRVSSKKNRAKKKEDIKLSRIRTEPVIKVKREESNSKIISGVSRGVSDLLGVNINIVRILFLISFVCVIGIPVYAFLSIVMKD